MMKAENSVQINKPVEDVFAFFNDTANSARWQNGVDTVEYADAEQVVGSQYTEVRKFMGREMRTTLEVTALEPNQKYAAKTLSGPVSYEVTITFEPSEGGTKMTTVVEGEPGGFFKLAEGAVAKQLKNTLIEDGQTLKEMVEAL
jgi:uncharacterized protein YndB with AHSA1/START domain